MSLAESGTSVPASHNEALERLWPVIQVEAKAQGDNIGVTELTRSTAMACHWMFRVSRELAAREHWPPKDRLKWTSADVFGDFLDQFDIPR